MITRPASRPHICLGCQRRLARPFHPFRPFYRSCQSDFSSYPSRNSKATSTEVSTAIPTDESAEATSSHEDANGTNDAIDYGEFKPFDRDLQNVRRTLINISPFRAAHLPKKHYNRYKVVEEKLGDFYGFRGQQLINERESLSVAKFGDPTEVIILRESKITRYDSSLSVNNREEFDKIDIIAQVEKERGLVSQKEVEDNINEFRPEADKVPENIEAFNNLVILLQEAFTTPQLERYIDNFKGRQLSGPPPPVANNPAEAEGNRILERGPWILESFDNGHVEENLALQGYTLASHTSKQKVVVRLLRECWMLELPDIAELIGQMNIQIRPQHLELLSKYSYIESIRLDVLTRQGENIEAFAEQGIIRITASQGRCNYAARRIELILERTTSIDLSLLDLMPSSKTRKSHVHRNIDRWYKSYFGDDVLAELAKVSGTSITRNPSTRSEMKLPISISCLPMPDDSWLVNKAHMAQRLLLSSADFSQRIRRNLGCRDISKRTKGSFIEHNSVESLSWREKLRSGWTRWTVPIGKEESTKRPAQFLNPASQKKQPPTPTPESKSIHEREDRETIFRSVPPGTVEDSHDLWSTKYRVESSAIFGKVLHNHNESKPEDIPKTPWGSTKTIRAFSSTLPNLSNLLQKSQIKFGRRDMVILHFQPNPFYLDPNTGKTVGSRALSAFPPVEMRFNVHSKTKDLELKTVDAVVEESVSDLMLPDQAVDVRFHQTQKSHLLGLHERPEIASLFKNSILTKEGRRFDLPATVQLPIATHLCKAADLSELGRNPEDKIQNIEYLFTNRENRSVLLLNFAGLNLKYVTIDKGAIGGKTSELILKPPKHDPHTGNQEFLQAVYDLAETLGSSSSFGSDLVTRYISDPKVKYTILTPEKEGPMPKLFEYSAKYYVPSQNFGFEVPVDDANDVDEAEDVDAALGEQDVDDAILSRDKT